MFDACSPHVDNVFGPWVSGCRKGFDFTLLFEQAIFSIIPSGLLIISGIFRLWKLGRHTPKIKAGLGSWLILWKQIVIICLTATQLALTILWASPTSHPTDVSLGASVLSLVATVLLVWLSFLEHDRSIRPSTVIQLFLLFSIVLDLPQARTQWLRHDNEEIAGLFATGLVLKLCGLLLEMVEKRRFLRHRYSNSAPESLAGIINISLLWWLNPLLIRGYSTILDLPALFNLSTELTSRDLQPRFRQTWAAADKERPHALIKVTAVCLWKPLLSTVVPRLLVICFKICQPLLTEKAVSLLSQPDSQYNTNVGRALIGATALTYIGMALMIARYKHNTYRLICMVRGGLVGLIYDATLQLGATAAEHSAAITLMDTDIERIVYGLELMDSLWAGPIEIAVALYLLSRQIGIFCLTAAVLAIIFIFCPLALSPFSRSAQRSWNQAVQERVAATASVLGHTRAVKIMGVTESLQTRLHDLRVRELQISARFRGILSVVITLNGMLRSVVPAASLILYVLVTNGSTSGSFNPTVAFTSLSLIALITDPVKLISRAITPMAGSVGCFQRVQEYLTSYQVSHDRVSRMSCSNCQSTDEKPFKSPSVAIEEDAVLRLKDADFAYDQVPEHCALRDISIRLQPSSCTMIVGPVGSGKSTLLLALLNELHLTRGCFHTPRSLTIGYCAQNPWLPHLSIREIITGSSDFDDAWYSTIVQTCALTVDIENMADGDEALVGSQGARMSGGQRQRLSLARALYARPQLLLLDDVLSGLDTSTEQIVVDSILGADGDMSLIDMDLPLALMDFLFSLAGCIAEAGLIVSASKWAALILPVLLLVLYIIQKFYLRSSRQLRLLDLEAKTPLYSHFLETLQGLTTIRAFGWQRPKVTKNNEYIDSSQKPYYLLYIIQCWLGLILDMTVAGLATFIMALATQLPSSSAGSLGVSLFWAHLETSLGAVARVKRFEEETPSEHLPDEKMEPPEMWPMKGDIRFSDVAATYKPDLEPVLKGLSLHVQPGQKVAICGRTGSGKSSLVLAILRLIELSQGDIFIDDIPLSIVPRQTIRCHITAMPQDPLIVSGTIRFNIDLSSTHPEQSIISALEKVGMWPIISQRGGLDAEMDTLALSRGQQQLFCLARTLLSNSKIIIFDEVVSNVDRDTARQMMDVIHAEFSGRTVLMITHDMESIRGFDHVVILDQGRGHPVALPETSQMDIKTSANRNTSSGNRFADLTQNPTIEDADSWNSPEWITDHQSRFTGLLT
ncbi:hypothetical protein MW887_001160 [Aspergillus wentii]|nr:hypothetical protein MW887_001160 [Aspergillus wentii]